MTYVLSIKEKGVIEMVFQILESFMKDSGFLEKFNVALLGLNSRLRNS